MNENLSSTLLRVRHTANIISGVSKEFSGYFNGIDEGKFLNRGLKNCQIKEN